VPFKQIITQDQDIQLIQSNIISSLTPLENQPMVGGNLLFNVSLTSAQDNLIEHGLNHAPVIFFIGNQNVDTRVWSPATISLNNASSNRTYLNLRCSTSCIVAVWVN
jgi:hypothetical protein